MEACRVCLLTKNIYDMRSVFMGGQSMYSLFACCFSMEIPSEQSAFLCKTCTAKLLEFNELKSQAAKNADYFLTRVKLEDFPNEGVVEKVEAINLEVYPEMYTDLMTDIKVEEKDDFDGDNASTSEEEAAAPESDKTPPPVKKSRAGMKYKRRDKDRTVSTPFERRCPNCLELFHSIRQLCRHMKQHEVEAGGLICDFCGKVFNNKQGSNRNNVMMHIRQVHLKDPDARFACDICGNEFRQEASVRTKTLSVAV